MPATALFDSIWSMFDFDFTIDPADGDVMVFVASTGKWTPISYSSLGRGNHLVLRLESQTGRSPTEDLGIETEEYQVFPPTLSDADAALGSIYFGSDHPGKKDLEPMLCRK